ncbi:MAG: type II secretion system F family protein [Ilumatobacteraceae bacterium]
MNPTVLLGSMAVIGSIFVFWFALSGGQKEEGVSLTDRSGPDQRRIMLRSSGADRALGPFAQAIVDKIRSFLPAARVRKLEAKITQAGLDEKWTLERVISMKILAAVVMFLLFAARLVTGPTFSGVVLMIAATVIGFFVPNVLIDRQRDDRKEAIRAQIADSIDQLNVMVRAGLGIDAALGRLAQSATGPIAEEFGRVLQDMRFGLARAVAFASMAERVDVPELTGFVSALSHAERLGVPISQTLTIQSQEMRERRRQMAEEKAMKLPVKLLFPMVFFILPVMFIVLLGPAAIRMLTTF